jgi:inhibitor of KinA
MSYHLIFRAFGANALLISWPNEINTAISADIYGFSYNIQRNMPDYISETISAYNSLTLFIHQGVDQKKVIKKLELLYQTNAVIQLPKPVKWTVPVCYDLAFGIDLVNLAQLKNISIQRLVELHTQALYAIDFIGFLPGFPYLSGLNPLLHTPRLSTPRARIAKGSIAIGGEQTGIYPSSSPGGWHIIGRTPLVLFEPEKENPCLFKAFDQIEFKSINRGEFEQIQSDNGVDNV